MGFPFVPHNPWSKVRTRLWARRSVWDCSTRSQFILRGRIRSAVDCSRSCDIPLLVVYTTTPSASTLASSLYYKATEIINTGLQSGLVSYYWRFILYDSSDCCGVMASDYCVIQSGTVIRLHLFLRVNKFYLNYYMRVHLLISNCFLWLIKVCN